MLIRILDRSLLDQLTKQSYLYECPHKLPDLVVKELADL